MKKSFFVFLLFLLPCLAFAPVHKFYVSVSEMEYVQEKKSVQIISRIFIDDFETVLNARYGTELFLATKKEGSESDVLIKKYIDQKMQVEINGNRKQLHFLGKEYENDMVLLYIEIPNVDAPKKVKIKNEVLFGLFPDQKNIVHFETKGETKSLLLVKGEGIGTLNFKH
ncbi:MAG TPA: DUF6702 family protein [Salinimicrobium sp.]|nr:DUF6702 family protein [Salinimicrobium sp.]